MNGAVSPSTDICLGNVTLIFYCSSRLLPQKHLWFFLKLICFMNGGAFKKTSVSERQWKVKDHKIWEAILWLIGDSIFSNEDVRTESHNSFEMLSVNLTYACTHVFNFLVMFIYCYTLLMVLTLELILCWTKVDFTYHLYCHICFTCNYIN